MKRYKPILLINLLFVSVTLFAQEVQNPQVYQMSLEECLRYAQEHNQNIIIANLEKEVSRAQTGEYMATGLPQVNANASVNKNFVVRKAFLPAEFVDPSAPAGEFIEVAFGTPYDADLGINLSQMIFNGSYFVGLKASRTYQELSHKEHIKSKIDVTEAVTKAYYTVLVNQMSLEMINSNFSRLDSLVRETTIRQQAGFVELLDLNRTMVEFNNIKTQKANAERAVEISRELLKFQMGMPFDSSLEITDKLDDLDIHVEEDINMGYNFQRRIEYSILQTNQMLAELDLRNNKVQYLPTLDLTAAWGMNAGVIDFSSLSEFSNRRVWPDYRLAGLSLRLPIFEGLLKTKKIQQSKLKIEQLDYQRQVLENNIRVEVVQMRKSLENNLEQLKSQEENQKLAESVYNQSKIKYQEGVGTNLEVIDADNAYKQAQTNYFNALYDALIAHVNYQKALGILKTE
ncbi:MAG: TolC family protein [Cyclobacteriaceae bacterium]|nr:TolC family protein [Cyclobacteriaceae bacterium]